MTTASWITFALWVTWFCSGITLEVLGLIGYRGMWPLTWLVRDFLTQGEGSYLVVILFIIGFPAWLVYHFLFEPRNYGKHRDPGNKG